MITTLEAARDFLAARYPKQSVSVDRSLWTMQNGKKDEEFTACVFIGDSQLVQSGKHPSIDKAVKALMKKADAYDSAAIHRRKQEEAKTLLESAGYTVSKVSKEGGE